jgi:plastocyanin
VTFNSYYTRTAPYRTWTNSKVPKSTMDGTERYINSGWIWPEGQVFPGASPTTSFTVTFEEPGTYPYICTVHPWMTGTVEVM